MKRKRKADYEEKLREEKSRELKHEAMDKWRRQIVQKHLEDKQVWCRSLTCDLGMSVTSLIYMEVLETPRRQTGVVS